MFKAGDHVPEIPFTEVVGKAAKVAPLQIGATALNVGTVLTAFTVIVIVVPTAHCPAFGVKL